MSGNIPKPAIVHKGEQWEHHSGRIYIVHEVGDGGLKINGEWVYAYVVMYYPRDDDFKLYTRLEPDFLDAMVHIHDPKNVGG